jgi:arrestin-related trafficking adapter 3/6
LLTPIIGIPPTKIEHKEEKKIRYQVIPFYNSLFSADDGYGAQCNYVLRNCEPSSSTTSLNTQLADALTNATRSSRSSSLLSTREQKRLSLNTNQSRSFQNGSSSGTSTPRKGYKTFHPGVYEYSFEITLDHTCPETMNLPMGSVRWLLESIVERSGAFKPNLHGTQEVLVVRAPHINSQELSEPININKDWEEQIHYEILISGKAFPIGAKMPIAFKFTPLQKIQLHRVRIFVTETVTYHCRKKRYSRYDNTRTVLVLEKRANTPLSPDYEGAEVRFPEGGEVTPEQRAQARAQAESWRKRVARATGTTPEPLPEASDSLMGDIDLGLDHLVGQTEMEVDVQLPTCEQMRQDKSKIIHPDSTFKDIEVNHWLKASRYVWRYLCYFTDLAQFMLRLVKLEPDGSGGQVRKAYEVSIESPVMILSCLATRARTSLPEYCGSNPGAPPKTYECGCPNANTIPGSTSTSTTRNNLLVGFSNISSSDLVVDAEEDFVNSGTPRQRPMHMLRYPSYSPPAFEADQPPPVLNSPPPHYDHVIGTPSHDGLADYFARVADVYDEDYSEDERELNRNTSRTGRVNVPNPRTPGGHRAASHSMEINRNFMFRPETFDTRLQAAQPGNETVPQSGDSIGWI